MNLQSLGFLTSIQDKLKAVLAGPAKSDQETNTFQKAVEAGGFGFEEHPVTTGDGYVLKVFRIKNDSVKSGEKKPIVFFQHGLFSNADTWMQPAFEMAKAGYDVWVGNNRGNQYSSENVHFSQTSDPAKFFDYSFQELGD